MSLSRTSLENDDKTSIKGFKRERNPIQELLANYDGNPEGAQRKKVSRYDLKKIFYNNETPFIFEKYVTELKRIFNVLEKYGVTL